MQFESEIFPKGMREGGEKNTHRKNTGLYSEKRDKSALFICVCFSDRDCKRYEGADSNHIIYFEWPNSYLEKY